MEIKNGRWVHIESFRCKTCCVCMAYVFMYTLLDIRLRMHLNWCRKKQTLILRKLYYSILQSILTLLVAYTFCHVKQWEPRRPEPANCTIPSKTLPFHLQNRSIHNWGRMVALKFWFTWMNDVPITNLLRRRSSPENCREMQEFVEQWFMNTNKVCTVLVTSTDNVYYI